MPTLRRAARLDPAAVLAALRPVEGSWVAVPPSRELPDLPAVGRWAEALVADVEPGRRSRLREALELTAEPGTREEDPDHPELVQLDGWRDTPTTAYLQVVNPANRRLPELTTSRRVGEQANTTGGRIRTRWVEELPTPAVHEREVDPGDPTLGWLARSSLLVEVRRPGLLALRRVARVDLYGDEATVDELTAGALRRVHDLLHGSGPGR
ncbi:hypothetical protein GC722_05005 [Auraticoccus sp. F435]|uniref:Uncharacterized protein n=1 Tax=Auraticoccus cholistanensis TaxID=2656650 RepID=A0A6A9URR7_9ACTN|nr:hypothetical protein [Auraticoccus cholistanensis]MVA75391.1 hypothetical protein [Auraticoccus cholistanensis]